MALLTADFPSRSGSIFQRKKLIFGVVVFAIAAAAAAGGFYFYKNNRSASSQYENSGLLPAAWLIKYFGTDRDGDPRIGGPDADPDEDLLTNYQEFYFGTDPGRRDTDGDGQYDGVEVAVNQNPTGPGELYATDYAKNIADKFIEDNGLEEFKEENIKKQVLGIMSPPESQEVEVPLPDIRTLNVITDESPAAVANYIKELKGAIQGLTVDVAAFQEILNDPVGTDSLGMTGQINASIDKLRMTPVPKPFLTFHQLHIAGLQAAARIFEIEKTIDPNAELEKQKAQVQQETYQIAVIQKANALFETEYQRLQTIYGDILR
ncbi:MAG: hypothetical protein HY545_02405 [Candidatus Doudnabacteria bacterium]|nr:hypothetical protein [Candidatus Doudnabacteria bacterium]